MDSILATIKKLLGIPETFSHYDVDVMVSINSAFSILRQLGVGPEEGFHIEDEDAVWEDFIGDDKSIEMLKLYVFQKVRLAFDPPATSFAIEALNDSIKEIEWRLCSEMDEKVWLSKKKTDKEEKG